MNLCKAIFGKDIYDLNINDLISFFSTEQEETSVLEFKSGDTSLEQIHKEVSAFLNTEGGILIIGAPREQTSGTTKICMGELKPAEKISNQDTLIRSIASNIAPSPINIKAKSFTYNSGMVFVLEIAQSITPPHQVSNEGKYYIRLERDAKAAPHGIVEALFNRRQRPQLSGEIGFLEVEAKNQIRIVFRIANNSVISAERIGLLISVYGVENVIKLENIHSQERFYDDKLTIQEILDNNVLVQGLSLEFSALLKLQNPFAVVSYAYYCKDGVLQTQQRLFGIQPFSVIKRYDSTKDPESDSKLIIEAFRSMQGTRIREILIATKSNSLSEPTSLETIFGLTNFLGFDLPDSYVAFLEISNGFIGRINDRQLKLSGIDELKTNNIRNGFERFPTLIIGFLNDYPVQLKSIKEDEKEVTFFIWDQFENNRLIMDNRATSFFQFLERINVR